MSGRNLNQDHDAMADVLSRAKNIAVVGHSDNPSRTSYQIAAMLRGAGYRVFAVNPTVDEIDGEPSYASLAEVPEPIDIVNIFRRSQFVAAIVDEAIEQNVGAVWTQLGVVDAAARDRALDAGIDVAMDRCIKVEYYRLGITRRTTTRAED